MVVLIGIIIERCQDRRSQLQIFFAYCEFAHEVQALFLTAGTQSA